METYTIEDRILKTPSSKNTTTSTDDEETTNTTSTDSEDTVELVKKTKKRPHSFPLNRSDKKFTGAPSLNKEQLQKAKERLRWYEKRDDDKKKTDQAKNEYEAIIYTMRDWLSEDENAVYVGMEERESIIAKLAEEEEWLLDGEGEFSSHIEYNQRHFDLRKKYDQFKSRKEEFESRVEAVNLARKKFSKIEDELNELSEKKPWIKEEQKKEVSEKIEEVKKWLNTNIDKQNQSPLNEDPVFKVGELEAKLQRLSTLYTKVSSTAKPKEKKKMPKNIKIDNMTFDGDSDMNWEDFININNGGSGDDEEIPQRPKRERRERPTFESDNKEGQQDSHQKTGAEEDL